jgi:uncharacterized membrane protein YqjE
MAVLAVVFYGLGFPTLTWLIAIAGLLWDTHKILSWLEEHKRGYYMIGGKKRHIKEKW